MPRTSAANPLYTGRYNDPAMGQIAQNIAGMLLGGQSPNEKAEMESEAALREARTEAERQRGRKFGNEADISGYTVADLLDPSATARQRTESLAPLTPEQQAIGSTLWQSRINAKNPRNVAEAESYNRDVASMLLDPTLAGDVGSRNAAIKGKPLYGTGGKGQTLQQFTGDVGQTPVSTAEIGKIGADTQRNQALARKADAGASAEGVKAAAATRKADAAWAKANQVPSGGSGGTGGVGGAAGTGGKSRPMPATSIKQLNESREALRASQSMETTFAEMRKLVEGGQQVEGGGKTPKLGTGPIDRATAAVQQFTGKGDYNSRGLLALKQKREKLRGDYLLLAKGVQTEGDAIRAMNAMMPDTNDPQAILDQLDAIQEASRRLQAIHLESVNQIESEYGRPSSAANPFPTLDNNAARSSGDSGVGAATGTISPDGRVNPPERKQVNGIWYRRTVDGGWEEE